MPAARPTHERLAEKLEHADNGCVVFTGSRTPKGYGQIAHNRRVRFTHRVAWELANGRPIPPGMIVMHTCDNPPCCNPAHLRLGTNADNTADMVAKRRWAGADRTHCAYGHELTGANVNWRSNGSKLSLTCRTCTRERSRENARRYRARGAA